MSVLSEWYICIENIVGGLFSHLPRRRRRVRIRSMPHRTAGFGRQFDAELNACVSKNDRALAFIRSRVRLPETVVV